MAPPVRTPPEAPCGQLAGQALFDALRAVNTPRPFSRGDRLAGEGDPPAFLGLVLSGRVKIVKAGEGGRDLILHVVGAGKAFGIVPVLDGEPYPASVAAVEDGAWCRVEAARFFEVVGRDPMLAMDVLRNFGRRLRRLAAVTQQASTTPVPVRLAARLRELSGGATEVSVTRQELADLAGTTVETAIRVTKAWEREGTLGLRRGRITIRDAARLSAVADGT